MEFEAYNKLTYGNSTCLIACPDGYTIDGDTEFHRCVKCDESCATCEDNGLVGDKSKCITCSETHPFMYAPKSLCMETCSNGYYRLGKDEGRRMLLSKKEQKLQEYKAQREAEAAAKA